MALQVTWIGPGGVIDSTIALDGTDAIEALAEMIENGGELHAGDVIKIEDAEFVEPGPTES